MFSSFGFAVKIKKIFFFLRPARFLSSQILNCASKKYEASPSDQHWLLTSGFFRDMKIDSIIALEANFEGKYLFVV